MKDPGRLVHEHPSAFARSLLSAAMDEEPRSSLLTDTLKLAVGSSATALTQASAPPPTGSMPPASLGSAGAGAGVKGSALLASSVKWVGIATMGGVLTLSGVRAFAPREAVQATPPLALHQPSKVAQKAPDVVAQTPTAAASVQSAPERNEASHVSSATRIVRSSDLTAAPAARALVQLLAEEAHVIDEARAAVAHGDGTEALRILENHRKRFDRPRLRPEALYLRMQALRLRGSDDAAARVAERLLADYPDGPQSAAARALLNARER